jgi:TPR repeat protein
MLRSFVIAIVTVVATGFFAAAQANPLAVSVNGGEQQLYKERHALLIGESQYSEGWAPLENIPAELDALERVLRDQGFKIVRPSEDPKGRALYETIRNFILEYGTPDNAIMIVFSGHGWTDQTSDTGYIVPVDAPLPENNRVGFLRLATSMPELRLLADQSTAMHTFFVFDSCFSGSIFITRSNPPTITKRKQDTAWFEQVRARGVQFLTSGDANQRVPAKSRFMPAFIDGIQGIGAADADGNGLVTAIELGQYFKWGVSISPQKPLFGDIGDYARSGDFIFQPASGPANAQGASDFNSVYGRAFELENGRGVQRNEAEAAKLYRQAADQGHLGAQANLGRMYRDGRGVKENDAEAMRWFSLAAGQGDPWAQSLIGSMYAKGEGVDEDLVEAARWYRRSADQSFSNGQNNLGNAYRYGRGVPKDPNEAARLFSLAMINGESNGAFNLGVMNINGEEGLPQNVAEGLRLTNVAAEKDNPMALAYLGELYQVGKLVPADPTLAREYFSRASDLGHARAQWWLGDLYKRGDGVPQDYSKALYYFQLAAEPSDIDWNFVENQKEAREGAALSAALLYYDGNGVPKDIPEAIRRIRVLADGGNTGAVNQLGVIYAKGYDAAPPDPVEAAKWYRLAAQAGSPWGQFNLAAALNRGSGVVKDPVEAVKWFKASAEQGNVNAQFSLGLAYTRGQGVDPDLREAIRWYTKAVDQNDNGAMNNLAVLYDENSDLAPSDVEAVRLWRMAAQRGNTLAQNSLKFRGLTW